MASRTHRTRNSVGMRFRYKQILPKLLSEAHRVSAEATACCAAAFSGTGFRSGFRRMASMLGSSL